MALTCLSFFAIFFIFFTVVQNAEYNKVSLKDLSASASVGDQPKGLDKTNVKDVTQKISELIENFKKSLGVSLDPLIFEDFEKRFESFLPGFSFGSIRFKNVSVSGLQHMIVVNAVVNTNEKSVISTLKIPSFKIEGKLYTDALDFPPRALAELKGLELKSTSVYEIEKISNNSKLLQLTGMALSGSVKKLTIKCSDLVLTALQSVNVDRMKKPILTQIIKIILSKTNEFLKVSNFSSVLDLLDLN